MYTAAGRRPAALTREGCSGVWPPPISNLKKKTPNLKILVL